jgi:hypothetical protein
MTSEAPSPHPKVGTGHYLALCGLCLAIIFLVQLQAGALLTNLLGVLVGALCLVTKIRLGPTLLVFFVSVAQLALHMDSPLGPFRRHRTMELNDVALCAAVLGYVIGHLRLQGIWHQLLPTDTRWRAGTPRRYFPWVRKQVPLVQEKRPAGQVTPQEIAWLVATLPIWAVTAQMVWVLFPSDATVLDIPPRLLQALLAVWLLVVGFYVARTFLKIWKQRCHDPAIAQLFLQDLLWRDTRGEQRRVNRWLAWWKLARKE